MTCTCINASMPTESIHFERYIQCNGALQSTWDTELQTKSVCWVLFPIPRRFTFFFRRRFYSSNSHLASHVLVLFLWECNPPVANEHLFAWIRYERGVTVSIAERIISHSTHSKRQPEDGSGPRAHRRALQDPAANLPSLR